jgi:hypothetical protein
MGHASNSRKRPGGVEYLYRDRRRKSMNLDSIMQMIQANAVIITAASVLTVLVLFFFNGKSRYALSAEEQEAVNRALK